MSKARILFVYPNERQMSVVPPAIALLSQLLKQNGHVTDIFDTTFYEFNDDIAINEPDKSRAESLQMRPVTNNGNNDLHVTQLKTDSAGDLRKK